MIKKHKVVIASLLKPVDETRMFEKFALSMDQTNKYELNIIGFYTKNLPKHPRIRLHPIFRFSRLSWQRVVAPWQYWKVLLKVKPKLIIVNSHDLLLVSAAHRIIFGTKVIYDIQENYKQNIIWSSSLPIPLRQLLANTVRLKEKTLKRMIVHFTLAEKCYLNECSFIKDKRQAYSVIENKAIRPADIPAPGVMPDSHSYPFKLVYSGTIAESYGIFDCLELVEKLRSIYPALELHIIGYCPRKDTLAQLEHMIQNKAYIRLTGGAEPVPHPQVLEALQEADYALIAYRLNPSNQDCFPTRIWECLAHKVPMLMRPEHPWCTLLDRYGAGLALDYHNPAPIHLHARTFYDKVPVPESFYWDHEQQKLLKLLDSLF